MGAKDRLRAAAVAGLLLTGFLSAFAQNWTLTSAPITNWSVLAMSANGSTMAAVANANFIGPPGRFTSPQVQGLNGLRVLHQTYIGQPLPLRLTDTK